MALSVKTRILDFLFPRDNSGESINVAPWGTSQTIGGTGVEAHTTAYDEDTLVFLVAETDCWIRVGVDAVSVATTSVRRKEGSEIHQLVKKGQRVSVYDGSLNITAIAF